MSLRLSSTSSEHDGDLQDAIDAATEQVEQDTDRVLITQTFEYASTGFPAGNIQLAQKPIQSIEKIEYIDPDGQTQTVGAGVYGLDIGGRVIYLTAGSSWPSTIEQHNSVLIEYKAGYGDEPASVPLLLQRAILLQTGRWFYDPAAENEFKSSAYDAIVERLLRTGYY